MKRGIYIISLLAVLFFSHTAKAEEDTICKNDLGECRINSLEKDCKCANSIGNYQEINVDGDYTGFDTSEEGCFEWLATVCDKDTEGVKTTCSNEFGECTVEKKFDMFYTSCICKDGIAAEGGTSLDENDMSCETVLAANCPAFLECSSDKGHCLVYDDYNNCICADGSHESEDASEGSKGSSGENSIDGDRSDYVDPDDYETARLKDGNQSCKDVLLATCPNDPPDPQQNCSKEAYEACNGIAEWMSGCYEEHVWEFMIIECCTYFTEDAEDIQKEWDCLKEADCDNGYDKCGSPAQSVGYESDEEILSKNDVENSDSSSSDCNHTKSGSLFILILMLSLLSFRKRIFNH